MSSLLKPLNFEEIQSPRKSRRCSFSISVTSGWVAHLRCCHWVLAGRQDLLYQASASYHQSSVSLSTLSRQYLSLHLPITAFVLYFHCAIFYPYFILLLCLPHIISLLIFLLIYCIFLLILHHFLPNLSFVPPIFLFCLSLFFFHDF